jgi:hypothetical protein
MHDQKPALPEKYFSHFSGLPLFLLFIKVLVNRPWAVTRNKEVDKTGKAQYSNYHL